jgi:glycosyltransferase involved in cell wall biosynthesis
MDPRAKVIRLSGLGLDRVARAALRFRLRRLFDMLLPSEAGWAVAVATWLARHADQNTIVVTTSHPPTAHIAAMAARSIQWFPWIADYRDPWLLTDKPMPSALHLAVASEFDAQIHRRADGLIYTSYIDLTNALREYRVREARALVVRNGVEEGVFERPGDPSPPPTILYCGNLYRAPENPQPRLAALQGLYPRKLRYDHSTYSLIPVARAIGAARRSSGLDIRLHVVGTVSASTVGRALAMAGEAEARWAETIPTVPKEEVAERCRAAAALYLPVAGRADGEACGWVPQKLFELLATDRAILMCSPAGEARSIVETSRGVDFLDGPLDHDARAVLRAVGRGRVHRRRRLWSRASQARQVEAFARRILTRSR